MFIKEHFLTINFVYFNKKATRIVKKHTSKETNDAKNLTIQGNMEGTWRGCKNMNNLFAILDEIMPKGDIIKK